MQRSRRLFVVIALAVALLAGGCGGKTADETISIGAVIPCEGWWGSSSESRIAGIELPLIQRGATLAGANPSDGLEDASVAGKPVELIVGCGDGTAERALSEARRLVEIDGADVLIAADQELAIRDYARTRPAVTFVGASALPLQAVTLHDPAPNFFRFNQDEAQFMAGLGDYAYSELGWRTAVTVADTYGHGYTRVAGFVAEFCALGGSIVKQIWVPPETEDFAPHIAEVPPAGVDGLLLAGWERSTIAFAEGVPQLEGTLGPRMVGSISVSIPPEALADRLNGVTWGIPGSEDGSFEGMASAYDAAFPTFAGLSQALDVALYYNAAEAVVQALEQVDGDLSDGQRRLQAALAGLEPGFPWGGSVRLDERRQAIGDSSLLQYQKNAKGELGYVVPSSVENVDQTFGGYFRPDGPLLGKDTIECKHGNPPPWTRDD